MSGGSFFYADEDSEAYDWIIGRTQPDYERLHEVLAALARDRLEAARVEGGQARVLDLGCGTGRECIALLAACPWAKVVALDISPRMLDLLRRKVQDLPRSGDAPLEVDCVVGDFSRVDTLEGRELHEAFDLVVSSLAIHHLSEAELGRLYAWISDRLIPQGIFLNADLFDFEAPGLSARAMMELEQWIGTQLDPNDHTIEPPPGIDVAEQRDKWIDHVRHENKTRPIEGADGHGVLLEAAGFGRVAVPFRAWQTGILWAEKA